MWWSWYGWLWGWVVRITVGLDCYGCFFIITYRHRIDSLRLSKRALPRKVFNGRHMHTRWSSEMGICVDCSAS